MNPRGPGRIVQFPLEQRMLAIRRAALGRLGTFLRRGDLGGARAALSNEPRGDEGLLLWGHVLERFLAGDEDGARDLLVLARNEFSEIEEFARGDEQPDAFCEPIEKFLGPAWSAHPKAQNWLRAQAVLDGVAQLADFDPRQDPAGPEYPESLFRLFEESPEGRALAAAGHRPQWVGLFLHYSVEFVSCTPAKMRRADLEEVLFHILPDHGACDPRDAEDLIAELRTFCLFLRREFELRNMDELLPVLDEEGVERFRAAVLGTQS